MAKFVIALFCLIALTSVSQANKVRYDLYSVYRVRFTTEEQFNILYRMDLNSSKGVKFWQLSHVDHFADVMVAPYASEDFLAFLDYYYFTYELLVDDVQKVIEKGY